MPIYEYACTVCGERTEARQSFADPPLEECPFCGGKLRKLYSPVGIVFKGSGFYATDARKKKGEDKAASNGEPAAGKASEGKKKAPVGKGSGADKSTGADKGSGSDKSSGSNKGSENKPAGAESAP
ncbi:MAG: FmdB family transcriptional regulator [Actinobacteria bacterium]|nr:FmdB family transcriptional regulator [Actinomycetota bacterium]